jgi:hypothetical protein
MPVRQFGVAHRSMRCRDVVTHHLLQGGELSSVHVRRTLRNAAKAWRLERTFQGRLIAHHEPQFLAELRLRIAERTQAIELVAAHLRRRVGTPAIGPRNVARRHPGVVELLVGEKGPVVAGHALRLGTIEGP